MKFIDLEFHKGSRQEKFNQLGNALKLGAEQALGKGFCFFLHPDGLYSDGMLKFLYGVAKSGKKACVSQGPVVATESLVPYLTQRGLYRFDEVNRIAPRVLAQTLLDNLHPDMAIHCLGNPHYPKVPYMGFWMHPNNTGALFRFVSLHPWMVDLSEIDTINEFYAIDHNFIRMQSFIWTEDVHIERDSDNFLVLGIKPRHEMNACPSPMPNRKKERSLAKALMQSSNCHYSRYCFLHGMKVHTENLDEAWHKFEENNLRWLNRVSAIDKVFRTTDYQFVRYAKLFLFYTFVQRNPALALQAAKRVLGRQLRQGRSYIDKFYRYFFIEKRRGDTVRYVMNVLHINVYAGNSSQLDPLQCAVCQNDARRCVSLTRSVTG